MKYPPPESSEKQQTVKLAGGREIFIQKIKEVQSWNVASLGNHRWRSG